MSGILYGVGVGPGDPELITIKAMRLIKENQNIALPGENPKETIAYKIVEQIYPEIADKNLISLPMPMTRNEESLHKQHEGCADKLEAYLIENESVVCLTIGDPTIYSTFSYLQEIIKKRGYETQTVSGIPSFCAAAATLNEPIVVGEEALHIIPNAGSETVHLPKDGVCVLMKTGRNMLSLKQKLQQSDFQGKMVENCGMKEEQIYASLEAIPNEAGYFSLIMVKSSELE